jgi:beta-glucuronidase
VAWYATAFDVPALNVVTRLRFNTVDYLAEVWLNGVRLGEHVGGHLPFEFNVSAVLRVGNNQLVVRVDDSLAPDRAPPGQVPLGNLDAFNHPYPDANFDFFPYCGIQRQVLLYSLPAIHLADVKVHTDLDGTTGLIEVQAQTQGAATAVCVLVQARTLSALLAGTFPIR